MKSNSIQFKYLITVIAAILAIAVFVGGFCIYKVDNYVQNNAEEFVTITCANEAAKINCIFGDIEKSVKIMESYVLSLFDRTNDIKNHSNQNEILQLAGDMFIDVAVNTEGSVAYYLRFDPAISDGTTGMFYTKMNGADEYTALEPTDLTLYSKDDLEHVGWFWQPYEAKRPIWLAPYYNQNNDILMISYVIPLYLENQFIGVVGMDFDYTVLTKQIHEIKIYESGFAHLELDGVVAHHGQETQNNATQAENDDAYLRVSEALDNGMSLVLSAYYGDIKQIRYEIAYNIIFSVLLVTFVFTLIVFFMVKKAVKPLKQLTNAAIKLSNGDYDVKIVHGKTFEVQQLSSAFETMLMNLREHEKYQHLLAYRDSLTGLRNATSYKKWITDFDQKIQNEDISFGIVMFDLNDLKDANDNYGHDVGDNLIESAAHLIADAFKRSPVFRIGGDEFVAILQNGDLENRELLFKEFDSECSNTYIETTTTKLPVRIAKGFSLFDPMKDTKFSDVFGRADEEMYKNKKTMKMV